MKMSATKSLPDIVGSMFHRDFVLALLYLKPGSPLIHEDAFTSALRKVAENYPQLQEKGFFEKANYNGCYGGKQTYLDDILDGLRFCLVADTPSLQYARLTASGKARVREVFPKEYGARALEELRPLAREVWARARDVQSMYNRQELYA